jgi:preprotein translocase subunit SecB
VENAPNNANTATQEQFGIQNVYVKDISFETPNSPQIFREKWNPQMELELSNKITNLDQDIYEVVLNITATVKVEEKTAFLVEVHQAGIFVIKGFTQDKMPYMLHSYCPNVLFPFARELISNIVARGGFQPLLLAPINFDALYAEQLKQNQPKGEKPTTIN